MGITGGLTSPSELSNFHILSQRPTSQPVECGRIRILIGWTTPTQFFSLGLPCPSQVILSFSSSALAAPNPIVLEQLLFWASTFITFLHYSYFLSQRKVVNMVKLLKALPTILLASFAAAQLKITRPSSTVWWGMCISMAQTFSPMLSHSR